VRVSADQTGRRPKTPPWHWVQKIKKKTKKKKEEKKKKKIINSHTHNNKTSAQIHNTFIGN